MRDVSVLLTRFSLPHPVWKTRTEDEYAAWLEVRLELLQRLTVPSVRNLVRKPDHWIIFAGRHEEDFLSKLEAVASKAAVPVTIVPYRGKGLVESLIESISGEYTLPIRLCTVRLDSDDAIASDFLTRLQSAIAGSTNEEDYAISFPGGAVYDSLEDRFGYLCFPDNAFLAHVEIVQDWNGIKSVYRSQHPTLCSELPKSLYLRSNHPMWCSIVHEHNLANQSLLRGLSQYFADSETLKRKFGMKAS